MFSTLPARTRPILAPLVVVALGLALASGCAWFSKPAANPDTGHTPRDYLDSEVAGATPDAGDAPILGCEAVGAARPVCGFQNPEDLVALPGGQAVLVSEYGGMEGERPGALSLLELASDVRRVLFRGGDARAPAQRWGSPECPGTPPASFSPHGIHLSRRADGALQLLVVQHGGRESIEFFEVLGEGTRFEVRWRGCVEAPDDALLNSVAGLRDGGFVTTKMMSRSGGQEQLQEAFSGGGPTGEVFEWLPGRGYRVVPNSQAAMPNGIEVSADGTRLFVNSSGGGEVRRIVRATGEVEARASIPSLDNARWAPDGRLLVASLLAGSPEAFAVCMSMSAGACPMEFQIVAVDPVTMETEVLYRNRGAPMGAGTIGLQVGNELLIGSFAGDRVLRVKLD